MLIPHTTTPELVARALFTAHADGTLMADLLVGSASMTPSDGFAAQELLARQLGQVIGWKVAASTRGGQDALGLTGPLAGRLFAGQRRHLGTPLSLAGNRMCTAEPEIGFVLGSTLAPTSHPRSADEVLGSVESLQLAWDVPSTRLRDPRTAGVGLLLSDNAFGHEVIAVRSQCTGWRHLNLAAHQVVVTSSDGEIHEGSGALALGDPRDSLTWLVNEVNRYGLTVHEGALIITGSLVPPIPVRPDLGLTADFGDLGSVGIQFVN